METGDYSAIKIVEKISNDAYKDGYKNGQKDILLKMAECLDKSDPEVCLIHMADLEDTGCCLNCVACIEDHFSE